MTPGFPSLFKARQACPEFSQDLRGTAQGKYCCANGNNGGPTSVVTPLQKGYLAQQKKRMFAARPKYHRFRRAVCPIVRGPSVRLWVPVFIRGVCVCGPSVPDPAVKPSVRGPPSNGPSVRLWFLRPLSLSVRPWPRHPCSWSLHLCSFRPWS